MTTISLLARLKEAALHAKESDDWGYDADKFHDVATPDNILKLVAELESRMSAGEPALPFTRAALQNIIETDHVQCGEAAALASVCLAGLNMTPTAYVTYKGHLIHAGDPSVKEYSEPHPLFDALAISTGTPEGWVLLPEVPTKPHLESIATRYRHDFYLLSGPQKESALATARQMYQECTGQGFYPAGRR